MGSNKQVLCVLCDNEKWNLFNEVSFYSTELVFSTPNKKNPKKPPPKNTQETKHLNPPENPNKQTTKPTFLHLYYKEHCFNIVPATGKKKKKIPQLYFLTGGDL